MSNIFKQKYPTLFWDVAELDDAKHAKFIIERVITSGTLESVKELFETFSEDTIKNTIRTSRRIDKKSAYFWKARLNITEPIQCLQKPSTKMLKDRWNS